MKIFIFEYVENLTTNYHSGGGLAVVAADRAAVERIATASGLVLDWEEVVEYDLREVVEERMFIFPDAGCC